MDKVTGGKKDGRIFMRADKGMAYDELSTVMNLLREKGYLDGSLVGSRRRSRRGPAMMY